MIEAINNQSTRYLIMNSIYINKLILTLLLLVAPCIAFASIVNYTLNSDIFNDGYLHINISHNDTTLISPLFDQSNSTAQVTYVLDGFAYGQWTLNTDGTNLYSLSLAPLAHNPPPDAKLFLGSFMNDIRKWESTGGWTLSADMYENHINPDDYAFYIFQPGEDFEVFDQFTASPVPIPSAIWLMGTALLGLLGCSRRKISTVI